MNIAFFAGAERNSKSIFRSELRCRGKSYKRIENESSRLAPILSPPQSRGGGGGCVRERGTER